MLHQALLSMKIMITFFKQSPTMSLSKLFVKIPSPVLQELDVLEDVLPCNLSEAIPTSLRYQDLLTIHLLEISIAVSPLWMTGTVRPLWVHRR